MHGTHETRAPQRDVARTGRQRRPGRRAADRSRHDARPHREGARRRHEVRRRRSVPVRSARQHRFDQRRPAAARRQGPRQGPRCRLAGRAGVAADRRRIGDGQRRGAEGVPDAGAQGVRDRPEAAKTSASAATASSASTRPPARRTGRRIPPATRRRSPRPSRRPPISPSPPASGSPPKGKSAGAACTACKRNVELLEMVNRPKTRRLPGRHGAHAALHDGLQRARGSPPARRTSTGRIRRRSTTALKKMTERAAAVDVRFPRRAERRHREGLGLARQDRPALPAAAIRTASSTSSSTPATGCATTRASRRGKLRHICWDGCMFPNAVMMQQKTWNDVLGVMMAVRDAHGWD